MFTTLRVRVFTDNTGAFVEIPAIMTPAGWLMPLIDYCLAHVHDRSTTWMTKVNRAVRLFLVYMQANPSESNPRVLFQNFAQRLYTGTFNRETGIDPSWLCWQPLSTYEASRIIRHLTDFFDWLGKSSPKAAELNPRYVGNAYDRMTDEAAYQYRREKAFLGHSWALHAPEEPTAYYVRPQSVPKAEKKDPPSFPEHRFLEFLTEGFSVGGRLNYRDMCITLLLHGAGFRASEPFHLFIQDVVPDPANHNKSIVRIHHPSQGDAPSDWFDERNKRRKGNRASYLAEKYGLAPRNLLLDSRHAGWKGGTHDDKWYKRAYWFIPEFGELFLHCWNNYLHQIAAVPRSHPFAFINLYQEPVGEMYGLASYNKAHARACQRVGLTVGKDFGTTPHGHRHAYGRRLVGGGVEPEMIRRFMHHSSLESQDVYTTPTTTEIINSLRDAAARLNVSISQNSPAIQALAMKGVK